MRGCVFKRPLSVITKKYVLSSGAVSWYSDKQPLKTSSSFELRRESYCRCGR